MGFWGGGGEAEDEGGKESSVALRTRLRKSATASHKINDGFDWDASSVRSDPNSGF